MQYTVQRVVGRRDASLAAFSDYCDAYNFAEAKWRKDCEQDIQANYYIWDEHAKPNPTVSHTFYAYDYKR